MKTSPFLANCGLYQHFTDSLTPLHKSRPDIEAHDFATLITELHSSLKAELTHAQAWQSEYADGSRLPAPRYLPGDKVWLSSKYLQTQRPSRKLDHKFLGPYEVVESVGTHAYRLKFPPSIKRHLVVHVSEIEPASDDLFPGQGHPPPPLVIVDGEEEWEVEAVVDSRIGYRRLEYRVNWVGEEETTWQPAKDLENAKQAVELYHQRYPERP